MPLRNAQNKHFAVRRIKEPVAPQQDAEPSGPNTVENPSKAIMSDEEGPIVLSLSSKERVANAPNNQMSSYKEQASRAKNSSK